MLFNYLLFDPKKYGERVLIHDGKVVNNKILDRDSTFNGIHYYFLKNRPNPYFYFSGTHNIPMLDVFSETTAFKKMWKFPKIDFFFYEPLTHYDQKRSALPYTPHILDINNEEYEIPYIRSKELDSISQWVEKHNISNLTVYCTDFKSDQHYQKIYPSLKLKSMDVFSVSHSKEFIKSKKRLVKTKPHEITKKFICLAWRYHVSRHMIMSYLAEKDIIKDSNVSFFFNIPNEKLKKNMWTSWREFSFKFPTFFDEVMSGNEKLMTMVPLSIEVSNPKSVNNQSANLSDDPSKNIITSHCPASSYRESCISIVLESRVTQPWPNISEKTLNSIIQRKPFIIVGAHGVLKMMRDMGFKTFNDYWDESYDEEIYNDSRIVKICNLVNDLSMMTIDEMRDMYANMSPILEHNFNQVEHLEKFFKKYNKLN
jgi:hypothetical protein